LGADGTRAKIERSPGRTDKGDAEVIGEEAELCMLSDPGRGNAGLAQEGGTGDKKI